MTPPAIYSRFYHPALAAKMEARVQIDPDTGCWNWTKGVNADGYGNGLYVDGKQTRAHRVAYMIANGYLPPRDAFVCHLCSNPSCCRPEHLAVGNAWDNAQDTKLAGRTGKSRKVLKAEALASLLAAEGPGGALAERFGLSLSAVLRHRRRADVEGRGAAKLTEADVRAIRSSEENARELAKRFGVTAPNIDAVRAGRTWKHVV